MEGLAINPVVPARVQRWLRRRRLVLATGWAQILFPALRLIQRAVNISELLSDGPAEPRFFHHLLPDIVPRLDNHRPNAIRKRRLSSHRQSSVSRTMRRSLRELKPHAATA